MKMIFTITQRQYKRFLLEKNLPDNQQDRMTKKILNRGCNDIFVVMPTYFYLSDFYMIDDDHVRISIMPDGLSPDCGRESVSIVNCSKNNIHILTVP